MNVTAHPTNAPGLIVHAFGTGWRLTHQSSADALGEFTDYDAAQDAATALVGVAEWENRPESLQDERVAGEAIGAIEEAPGRFLYRPGGLGERVYRARHASEAVCVECDHLFAVHGEGEDPVTPGVCSECPEDEERHDFRPADRRFGQ